MMIRRVVAGTAVLLFVATVIAPAEAEPSAETEGTATTWAAAIDRTVPEGYLYEKLRRCAGCHEPSRGLGGNSTHLNAIGIMGDPDSPALTG